MDYSHYYPALSILITVVVGTLLTFRQLRSGKSADDNETIGKYEQAVAVRDIEIRDLRTELAKQKDQTAEMIKALQIQITALQAQVTALTTEKRTLEETVTGEKYLIQITKAVIEFESFAKRAQEDHGEMIKDLDDIKNLLSLTNRSADSGKKASH